jgi:hypothetical protein
MSRAGILSYRTVAICVTLLLGACAVSPGPELAAGSPTLGHVQVVALPDGHQAVRIRSYSDELKTAHGDQRVSVEYLWDYTGKVARQRTFDTAGVLIEDVSRPGLTLNATDEELAWAIEVAKADPVVAPRLLADTTFYGGFGFREPGNPDCDLGSRCIHLIGSRDGGRSKVFHALVDLQTARVVAPDFDPAMGGIEDQSTKPE